MKPIIYRVLSLLLLCQVAASCVSDPASEPEAGTGLPTLSISLGLSGRTRADAGGEFEDGVGYENYLDLKNGNFRIYFFDHDDNTFIARFNPTVIPAMNWNDELKDVDLRFIGNMPPKVKSKFKMVVLANWSNYPEEKSEEEAAANEFVLVEGTTTIEDLTTHVGSQFRAPNDLYGDGWLRKDALMPFYGVRAYDLKDLFPAEIDEEGKVKQGAKILMPDGKEIPMLRALARVEVILDHSQASFEDVSFDEVSMSRVNKFGFAAPYKPTDWNYDYNDYFKNKEVDTKYWEYSEIGSVHLTENASSDNKGGGTNDANPISLQFTRVKKSPETWVAYVPEYRNTGEGDTPTTIKVTLKNPEGTKADNATWTKEIHFSANGTKDEQDIERNHIYRFTINGMSANLDLHLDIQPFAEKKLTFEFGLMRDERGDLMVLTDDEGNLPDYFTSYMDKNEDKWPKVIDPESGEETNDRVTLEPGDYYAIVVGEYEDMSQAQVWIKDSDGCRVLTNFEKIGNDSECNARLVEDFFGLNESERYHKDRVGYRRVYHFDGSEDGSGAHNTIVISPYDDKMYFCRVPDDYDPDDPGDGTTNRYYEVESWDETACNGYIRSSLKGIPGQDIIDKKEIPGSIPASYYSDYGCQIAPDKKYDLLRKIESSGVLSNYMWVLSNGN